MSKVSVYDQEGKEYKLFPIDAREAVSTGMYFDKKPEPKHEDPKPAIKPGPKPKVKED